MKRTHKRSPSPQRRALEVIAAHPEGCTNAFLAAENIPADVLIELVRSGLVVARNGVAVFSLVALARTRK
jgi:hypothetical protein